MWGKIALFFHDGGIWMFPITFCSFISLGIVIERSYILLFTYAINGSLFMQQIQKLVMANNLDRAISLCNAAGKRPLPQVIKAGLLRANETETSLLNALEESTLEYIPLINARIGALPNIANLSTLLGLLGTIIGLIEAFSAVAAAPADMKSQLLTQALAIGLNTTAYGLLVAIPTLAAYAFLQGRTKKFLEDLELFTLKLQNLLIERRHRLSDRGNTRIDVNSNNADADMDSEFS
jgi:biopolymer transport protein ExbB/TolQ